MDNRRPLAVRSAAWAGAAARALTERGVTPNAISMASVGFAALAFGALAWSAETGALADAGLYLIAAAAIQARLICNLLDGMVAVEGGRSAPDGPFWNEAPDRLADLLILWGAGLAIHAPALGLFAAAMAILTAYLRELGRAEGLGADFSGPMAKQHRMAVLTVALVLSAPGLPLIEPGLWIVALGGALTAALRARRIVRRLRD